MKKCRHFPPLLTLKDSKRMSKSEVHLFGIPATASIITWLQIVSTPKDNHPMYDAERLVVITVVLCMNAVYDSGGHSPKEFLALPIDI